MLLMVEVGNCEEWSSSLLTRMPARFLSTNACQIGIAHFWNDSNDTAKCTSAYLIIDGCCAARPLGTSVPLFASIFSSFKKCFSTITPSTSSGLKILNCLAITRTNPFSSTNRAFGSAFQPGLSIFMPASPVRYAMKCCTVRYHGDRSKVMPFMHGKGLLRKDSTWFGPYVILLHHDFVPLSDIYACHFTNLFAHSKDASCNQDTMDISFHLAWNRIHHTKSVLVTTFNRLCSGGKKALLDTFRGSQKLIQNQKTRLD